MSAVLEYVKGGLLGGEKERIHLVIVFYCYDKLRDVHITIHLLKGTSRKVEIVYIEKEHELKNTYFD